MFDLIHMKRICVVLMALSVTAVLTSFVVHDKRKDKVMDDLWRQYETAMEYDRIRKASDILEDIRDIALRKGCAWDFYDAWEKYVQCCTRRDWKLHDELAARMDEEVRGFGEPVLTYLLDSRTMSAEELVEKINADALLLRTRKNIDVYEGYGTVFSDIIVPTVRNDYEFVLWHLFASKIYDNRFADVSYKMLLDEIGDVYPQAGLAEYHYIMNRKNGDEQASELEDFAKRYEGRAVALPAYLNIARIGLESAADKEDQEFFMDFRERLKGYERLRESYRSGVEKLIADRIEGFDLLIRHLDEEVLSAEISDGKAELYLRNIDKLKIRILDDGETVGETVLENPVCSYYACDTLHYDLPALDDGNYIMEFFSGARKLGERQYQKYSLSMACRQDAEGFAIYVADYRTGRPVECVDLEVVKSGKVVETVRDFRIEGFARLPESVSSILDGPGMCYLRCMAVDGSGRKMKSKSAGLRLRDPFAVDPAAVTSAVLLPERSAYNPDETVRYKAVIYESLSDGSLKTVAEGEIVTVELKSPNGETLASEELRTNEFGSVVGGFPLDRAELYGVHSLVVSSSDGSSIGSCRFAVDEYVLPAFDLVFDSPKKVFHEGDEVVVTGKVMSLSGHSLSSASLEAVVSLGDRTIMKESFKPAPDGSFAVSFKDEADEENRYRSYSVEIKVADVTGETKSFHFSQPVLTEPRLEAVLYNSSDGSACLREGLDGEIMVLDDEHAEISCIARYHYGARECKGLPLEYRLLKDGDTVLEGGVSAGDVLDLPFEGLRSGLYRFVLSYGGVERQLHLLRIREDDSHVCHDVENVFYKLDGDDVRVHFGAGCAPVWAAVEWFDGKGRLLESDLVYLEKGELKVLEYGNGYGTGVRMKVLYFRNGRCYSFSETWTRPLPSKELPLSISSFRDEAAPGSDCSVSVMTDADAEVLVSVFDVATEHIMPNRWRRVTPRPVHMASVPASEKNGMDGDIRINDMGREFHLFMYGRGSDGFVSLEESTVVGYGSRMTGVKAARKTGHSVMDNAAEEAIPFQLTDEAVYESLDIREDFSASLAFEPFLRPDEDGSVNLDFKTSDKLSAFVVSVFAHDKDMNNALVRREMVVTLPVMLSVVQPQYLYAGDRYVLNASVSNTSSSEMQGIIRLDVFNGTDYKSGTPLVSRSADIGIAAGSSSSASFDMDVPSGVDTLGFRLLFTGTAMSSDSDAVMTDGLFVTVPVYVAEQVIEEAHSAVLLEGKSEEMLLDELKGRFVNGSYAGAEYAEVTVLDMLYDALPFVAEAESNDAVALSEAMYVNLLAAGLRAETGEPFEEYVDAAMRIASKILACRDANGGFAWFEGMNASPIITAVVLERFAGIRDRGLLPLVVDMLGEDAVDTYADAVAEAVRYLDSDYFNASGRPVWHGRLSLWQYLNVRSKYVGVSFDTSAARRADGGKRYREFRKSVKECLTPSGGGTVTDGAVVCKARMLAILDALSSSEQGLALAGAWGLSSSSGRIRRTMRRELASLKEYAVGHPSGGIYYPAAVIPFKGLLESEAYAHALISDLFRGLSSDEELGEGLSEMADGISLWMMLQKETQQWGTDAGFVEAMASICDASDDVKSVKVIVLKKRFLKPFEDVKASGNGFRISVEYHRDGRKLSEGDVLHLGERITARYSLWSEENRSFVRLAVPRPACMRPEQQLSGWAGGWLRPLAYGSPYAYREVKADRTLYWIDVFPEEDTVIEEELFVTQEGTFISPAAEIESLYAPHYRANDGFRPSVSVLRR